MFIKANCVDLDEMSYCVAFHLGLHCLPKDAFRTRLDSLFKCLVRLPVMFGRSIRLLQYTCI